MVKKFLLVILALACIVGSTGVKAQMYPPGGYALSGGGSPTPTPTPTPGGLPNPTPQPLQVAHVHTMMYYGGLGENEGIPASWVAAHIDIAEGGGTPTQGNAFLSNGGWFSIDYTDPNLIPHCDTSAPYKNCTGAMGPQLEAIPGDAGYSHDTSGNRLNMLEGSVMVDMSNPTNAASIYAAYVAGDIGSPAAYNGMFTDDTTAIWNPPICTNCTALWDFYFDNRTPVEFPNQATWGPAETGLLNAADIPLIYNGFAGPFAGGNLLDEAMFLQNPDIAGAINEDGIEGGNVQSLEQNCIGGSSSTSWICSMDALLEGPAYKRYGVELIEGTADDTNRNYGLGSFWLWYDPNYSFLHEHFASSDGFAGNFAEEAIVPTGPLTTASNQDITTLKTGTGAYLREFTTCYQNGTLIGHCAAVVNPTVSTVNMPTTTQTYTHSLVYNDTKSWYGGGTVGFTGSIPSTLASGTAVLLH